MIIIFISGFLGCLVGVVLVKKHKTNYYYFKELSEFFNHLKHSISFSQKDISGIVLDFYSNKSNAYFKYQDYLDYLNSKSLNVTFKIFDNDFLSENEKIEIEEIFNGLGKLNLTEEVKRIETVINLIEVKRDEKKENFKKYSNMYIKLGILFGLGIGVILI